VKSEAAALCGARVPPHCELAFQLREQNRFYRVDCDPTDQLAE
jgi:hypothetical protein